MFKVDKPASKHKHSMAWKIDNLGHKSGVVIALRRALSLFLMENLPLFKKIIEITQYGRRAKQRLERKYFSAFGNREGIHLFLKASRYDPVTLILTPKCERDPALPPRLMLDKVLSPFRFQNSQSNFHWVSSWFLCHTDSRCCALKSPPFSATLVATSSL